MEPQIFLSANLLAAVTMAARVHGAMKRKDGSPYLLHPIAVLTLLYNWGADESTCIAGLLHDVIEDAENDEQRFELRKEIESRFGRNVLGIVESVTEQDRSLPWKTRKKHYLSHLKEASLASLLVSCADRTHNVQALVESYQKDGETIWQRFNAPKEWQVWFIDQTAAIYKERLDERFTAEFFFIIKRLNALLSQDIPLEYRSTAIEITDQQGKKRFIIDPLYLELRDHCMLTEKELEDGMLEEVKDEQSG